MTIRRLRIGLRALVVPALLVACGDDSTSSDSATDSDSSATESSATDTTTTSDGSATASGTTTSDSGSASDSEGTSTTGDAETDSASGTSSTTTGDETTTTGDETTGPAMCEGPPAGYDGPADPECAAEPQIGMFNPVVEWKEDSYVVQPASTNVMMTPIVTSLTDDNDDGKIDGDDVPDIVYITYTPGVLRATSGDGSGTIFSVGAGEVASQSGVAAGDIDGDGVVELIAVGSASIHCYEHDGTKKWSYSGSSADIGSGYSTPSIADLDGDGVPEVISGRTILHADGTLRGKGTFGVGGSYGASSFAADLDNDGIQEVVVGNALYDPDGAAIWSNGQADGYPAIADFDLDGVPEIVVVSSGNVRLQDASGATLWTTPLPGNGGGGGPPTVADYDGDGVPEIGVAGRDVYAMFDDDGTLVWHNMTQDLSSGFTGSSVYDFEGDGVADVLYADETNLWVYSGIDGSVKLQFEAHNSNTAIEYPLVADLDADGQVEIVLGHNTTGGHGPEKGITVIGDVDASWRPGRPLWNQHAYSITNVNDDGTIPAMPAANWTLYNNFRSGDLSPPDGAAAPDLTVEATLCDLECHSETLLLWVHLGNVGASALTAGATLEVLAVKDGVEAALDEVMVADPLDPGQFAEALTFDVSAFTDADGFILRVSTPDEECDLANNELVIDGPFCA
ncbi:MAG: VCBS repeat-containing protein [Nannocystaceae bacterium]